MGKRGPKPTPLTLLKARGSKRAKDREGGPEAPPGCPDPPVYLRPEARRTWELVVGQLDDMGILSEADGNALARYCQAVAKYIVCEEVLTKDGLTYEQIGTNGAKTIRERPESKLAIKLSEECRKIENLFGLNPSARTDLAPRRIPKKSENRGRRKKTKSRFFEGVAG